MINSKTATQLLTKAEQQHLDLHLQKLRIKKQPQRYRLHHLQNSLLHHLLCPTNTPEEIIKQILEEAKRLDAPVYRVVFYDEAGHISDIGEFQKENGFGTWGAYRRDGTFRAHVLNFIKDALLTGAIRFEIEKANA